jgi:predicted nuclease of predicted toxin-antitoxin system
MQGFLVDENLPARLAAELSARGLPSRHVSDIPGLRSSSDDEVVSFAEGEGLVVLTKDKELSLVTRLAGIPACGVVCVRITDRMAIDEQVRLIVGALTTLDSGDFPGNVIVVEPGRIRVRRGSGQGRR